MAACSMVEPNSEKRKFAANEALWTELLPKIKNDRNEKKLGKPVGGIAARAFACHTRGCLHPPLTGWSS